MPNCKCKRSKCRILGCGSLCVRCGCECDGISIAEKMARTRGSPSKTASATSAYIRIIRKSKRSRVDPINYAEESEIEDNTPAPEKKKIDIRSIHRALGLDRNFGKYLPSMEARQSKD